MARHGFRTRGFSEALQQVSGASAPSSQSTNASVGVPDRPWARIHVDYTGPIEGKMMLIIVDAHSKWLEALVVNSATSQTTIEKLCSVFATHGIPEVLVSDDGSVFTSAEFDEFVRRNGIKHLTSVPYHPASNGLAERAVQTVKTVLKKATTGTPLETRMSR